MDFSTLSNGTAPTVTAQNQTQNSDSSENASASEAATDVTQQSEDFDTFLKLLTAQISNQDPLAPVDSTQFVEQLATFSNLELQAKNNQILERIASMLAGQLADNPQGSGAI